MIEIKIYVEVEGELCTELGGDGESLGGEVEYFWMIYNYKYN